jgi:fatty acid desaturase
MFMHLPCWSLPRAHRLLTSKGVTARMEVRPGYLDVIRTAASGSSEPASPIDRGETAAPLLTPFG